MHAPAHICQDSHSERPTEVVSKSMNHSMYTHFPKRPKLRSPLANQNDKDSLQKMHWRSSTSSRKVGDLITADRKVLNEEGESRNNHRSLAVVVQDLATPWIQSCSCKTKTSQETEKSLRKFLEPSRKPKGIKTFKSLEFGKSCEDLS